MTIGLPEQVRERCLAERTAATYIEFQARIDALTDDWHRHMLTTLCRHWWSEIVGDLETTMATLVAEPYYRFYGTRSLGTSTEVKGGVATRAMYSSLYDAGYFPGGVLDDVRIAFADWGLFVEAKVTNVLPGAALNLPGLRIDSNAAYQNTCQTAQVHAFDRESGLLLGEIVYLDDPIEVFMARR